MLYDTRHGCVRNMSGEDENADGADVTDDILSHASSVHGITHVHAKGAPTSGVYSHAVRIDPTKCDLLFLSGQTGNDPNAENEAVAKGGLGPQVFQALLNALNIIKSQGGDASSIISVTALMKDVREKNTSGHIKEIVLGMARKNQREAFDHIYRAFFTTYDMTKENGNLPARTMYWVPEVSWEWPTEDTVVELQIIAAVPKEKSSGGMSHSLLH